MRKYLAISLLLIALSFGACASKSGTTPPPPSHPGAVNAFDSTAYDALVSAQAAIEQAKVGIPQSQKALLNKIITGYNKAESAYVAYHTLALSLQAKPDATQSSQLATQQAALQGQIDALTSQISTLKAGGTQ